MKLICSLLILLSASYVFAQSAPPLEGDLIGSGALVFENKVTGYFRLADNRKPEDENHTYTITLLGNDLQALGNKVYESDVPLSFESIAYNGTYLGVMFKETKAVGKRYLDVINGAGERVKRETVSVGTTSRGTFLYPTKAGFIACAPRNEGKNLAFGLRLLATDGETKGWEQIFTVDKKTLVPRLTAAGPDRLVLTVQRHNRLRTRWNEDTYCLNSKTGELVFKIVEEKANTPTMLKQVYSGALVGNGVLTVRNLPASYKESTEKGFKLFLYSEAGDLMQRETYYDEEFFRKALATNNLPPLPPGARAVRRGIRSNREGVITVAYEVVSERDETGEKVWGLQYQDGYVVAITPDFKPGAVFRVEKTHFTLSRNEANGLTPNEVYAMRRRMSKGQFDKLDVDQLVALHDGPHGYALSVRGEDYISNYFFDREFTKEQGVVYHGVRVATFIDGEFKEDYIPFKDQPDFITLAKAQSGYLKVTEYKYGKGIVDIRLERLSY